MSASRRVSWVKMLRRLTYDGDYLMIGVIGATPAVLFWAVEPISNVCDWFKQRLLHIPSSCEVQTGSWKHINKLVWANSGGKLMLWIVGLSSVVCSFVLRTSRFFRFSSPLLFFTLIMLASSRTLPLPLRLSSTPLSSSSRCLVSALSVSCASAECEPCFLPLLGENTSCNL